MAREVGCGFIIGEFEHEIITVRGSIWLEPGEKLANTPDVVEAVCIESNDGGSSPSDVNPLTPVLNTDELTVETEDGDVVVPALEGIRIPISGQKKNALYKILVKCWTNGNNPVPRRVARIVNVHCE